jgi:hypothetical protein
MKIIATDNLDRDDHADKLIAENVDSIYAGTIVNALNAKYSGEHAPLFFTAVNDNYPLKEGFQP